MEGISKELAALPVEEWKVIGMATIYTTMMYVGFSMAGIFFCISLFIYFQYNISKVIGDLTGRTQKRDLALIIKRRNHAKQAAQAANTTTDSQKGSDWIKKIQESAPEEVTTVLEENVTIVLSDEGEETQVLQGEDEMAATAVLGGQSMDGSTTEVLTVEEADTTQVLNETTGVLAAKPGQIEGVIPFSGERIKPKHTIEKVLDIMVVHTEETLN